METAEELIRAGASLSAKNEKGKTPMDNSYVQKLKELKPELFENAKNYVDEKTDKNYDNDSDDVDDQKN